MKTIEAKDIEIRIIPVEEDMPVRGNAMASGDEDEDRRVEDDILERLQYSVWAWACIEVRGEWKGLRASAYLGGCSYDDEDDFRASGYYEDMVDEVTREINAKAEDIALAIA